MGPKRSHQEEFAVNLEGHCRGGTAIYHPLEFRPDSNLNRVGDIAFFNSSGEYKWIQIAFNSVVLPFLISCR
jgi:hypothetical protein